MLDLDRAREVIEAEKCKRRDGLDQWCATHGNHWSVRHRTETCMGHPEAADVATELLAAIDRVQALYQRVFTEKPAGGNFAAAGTSPPERRAYAAGLREGRDMLLSDLAEVLGVSEWETDATVECVDLPCERAAEVRGLCGHHMAQLAEWRRA